MSCLFRTSHFGYDKVRDICANGETVIVNWGASDWLWNAFGVLLVVSIVLIVASSVLLTTMLGLRIYRDRAIHENGE